MIIYILYTYLEVSWNGATPSYHPFFWGFSMEGPPSSCWGDPILQVKMSQKSTPPRTSPTALACAAWYFSHLDPRFSQFPIFWWVICVYIYIFIYYSIIIIYIYIYIFIISPVCLSVIFPDLQDEPFGSPQRFTGSLHAYTIYIYNRIYNINTNAIRYIYYYTLILI